VSADICADLQTATPADSGESDDEGATEDVNDCSRETTVTFSDAVQSLCTLRSYLEKSGCQEYQSFYDLSDQVYEINKKKSVQSN